MGADSTESRTPLTLGRQAPIFRIQSLLLGFASTSPLASYLRYILALRSAPMADTLEEYLRNEFVNLLREYRKDPLSAWKQAMQPSESAPHGQLDQTTQAPQATRVLLVGAYGRLFTVWSHDQVVEALNGYDALGVGADVALGALYATRGQCAEERVKSALRAAARLTGVVRQPFYVVGPDSAADCTECQDSGPHPRAG
jgi:ATP-dependent protease HslVU (ClpYQ) peptidase subunit